ncbi:MAG: hypothetical protein CL524_13080 [Aequorivita sp.]|nr:hypothetical protein [Aequorivita sp.]|tara:strand:+ start:1175 stop:1486 length:312 start_codon:yes stop_codon:yes gene_type:complete
MKESDRMRLLVVDACDTMSRMGDRTMQDSANGISEHLEELLLSIDSERAEDLMASTLVVVLSLLKPLTEQVLANTDGRYTRSRVEVELEAPEENEDDGLRVYS